MADDQFFDLINEIESDTYNNNLFEHSLREHYENLYSEYKNKCDELAKCESDYFKLSTNYQKVKNDSIKYSYDNIELQILVSELEKKLEYYECEKCNFNNRRINIILICQVFILILFIIMLIIRGHFVINSSTYQNNSYMYLLFGWDLSNEGILI
ncbi:hypothetical protein RCL_jg2477.t1 [Rhizophagus clarus]|uniref:IMD domain-containing protein n=1 Tax=Rhizophagus clarus TaxID=94130 RepID=A0A8H3L891_9GLOM|nr:hypothetical protein RCL_jg2477.t1 [Rhizophagus clarus]